MLSRSFNIGDYKNPKSFSDRFARTIQNDVNKLAMFDQEENDDDTIDNSNFECNNTNYNNALSLNDSTFECDNENDNIDVALNDTESIILHSPSSVSSSPVQI